jgi:hypothetical protein
MFRNAYRKSVANVENVADFAIKKLYRRMKAVC